MFGYAKFVMDNPRRIEQTDGDKRIAFYGVREVGHMAQSPLEETRFGMLN